MREAVGRFRIEGELVGVEPLERGHIHDTFVSSWRRNGSQQRFLHQRMNDKVFQDIPAVMHNIETVSRHLRGRMQAAATHDDFDVLDLVPTREQRSYAVCESGQWRTYVFVEDTRSFDVCSGPEQAYEAARAFGWFQRQLADLDATELRETLPHFLSTPHRLQQFDDALANDPLQRAATCPREIDFVHQHRELGFVVERLLRAGMLPTRIVHGDTKLNNVLFGNRTGKARCIVDLDTCMPGYSLYDFGDLVRFTAATSSEDELDLERVGTHLELYRALVAGYRDGAGDLLLPREVELMPVAARLVTFTIGLRFLTDYLAGDVYFKVHRPEHNLERARVQLRMVERMEQRAAEMAVR